MAINELSGNVLRAGDVRSTTLTTSGAASTASLSTGKLAATDVSSKTMTVSGALGSASLNTGNIQASTVNATSFGASDTVSAATLSATRLNVTYLQLPRRSAPPFDCNNDTLGQIYFDTERTPGAASNDRQLPCVCLYYAGYGPRWRQFDNVDAECR